jgi:hypothetical protein
MKLIIALILTIIAITVAIFFHDYFIPWIKRVWFFLKLGFTLKLIAFQHRKDKELYTTLKKASKLSFQIGVEEKIFDNEE